MGSNKQEFEFPQVTPTVNISVTGHRMNQISEQHKEKLESLIRDVLQFAKDEADKIHASAGEHPRIMRAGVAPRMRLISSLAEGADRMAAQAARDSGYELFTILPQNREKYKESFELEEELPHYEELLGASAGVMEIACGNPETSFAYADTSQVMLRHTDILLSVWNGKKTKYVAGTYATIKEAINEYIPILHLPAEAESLDEVRIFHHGRMEKDWRAGLHKLLKNLLLPPPTAMGMMPELFSGHCELPKQSGFSPEKVFESFVMKPWQTLASLLPFRRKAKTGGSPAPAAEAESDIKKKGNAAWGRQKRLFSQLSGYYSERYRTSLLLRNIIPILALLSLLVALSGEQLGIQGLFDPLGVSCSVFFIVQITLLFSVIYLVRKDKKTREHTLSYGYRVLAEKCRLNIFLWGLGFSNVQHRHRSYQVEERRDPVSWYYRALVREVGPPDGALTTDTLRDWLKWLDKELFNSQMKYHTKRKDTSLALSSRMRYCGQFCYVLGITATVVRAFTTSFGAPVFWGSLVSCLALFLPTMASFWASYANNIGLPTNYSASSSMEGVFRSLRSDVADMLAETGGERIFKDALSFTDALSLCERVNLFCMDDLSDWEHSIQSKNIKYI